MASFSSHYCLDKCRTISISYLKKEGYLKANQLFSGSIAWRKGDDWSEDGRVGITVAMFDPHEGGLLTLNYSIEQYTYRYTVQIIALPSNLKCGGYINYFICPSSKLMCRNLYQVDYLFLHRRSLPGYYYSYQGYSRDARRLKSVLDHLSRVSARASGFQQPYCKSHYRGKPTRLRERLDKKEKRLQEACMKSIDFLGKLLMVDEDPPL